MPEFSYTARNVNGEDVMGTLSAATRRDAVALLAGQALCPLRVEPERVRASVANLPLAFRRRIRTEIMSATLTQLGDLLENGVPLLDSLRILAEQAPDARLREIMQRVHDQVAEGAGLDDAMAAHPAAFHDLTISMVRAGTEGAFLEEALRRVATFLERQEEIKGKVTGALAYPAFLAVFGTLVTTVLVVFFVPKFDGLFERLERSGNGLPVATTTLLAVSEFLRMYWWLVLAGLGALLVCARQQYQRESIRYWLDRQKLKLPLMGKIFHNTAVSRFCRVLGTLLRNGVPLLKSLQISSASSGNRLLAEVILKSAENVSAGESLTKPLAHSQLLPPDVMAMIAVAEESNNLDSVLVKIADRIDQKTERQLSLMVRLIEPVMLVLIGGAVMFVLVALLLPIVDASSTVG